MAGKVEQLTEEMRPDSLASQIFTIWQTYYNARATWMEEQKELRNYTFATDTTKTSNRTLPWRNSTTIPKLTQIRDNLHANYMAALFPNPDWLKWEGSSLDDSSKAKREAIEAYMKNKTRLGGFRTLISRLVYDYIDYGNAIADVEWVNEVKDDPVTGEKIPGFVGPRPVRISPMDIVFNPIADSFVNSPKLTRKVLTLGELVAMSEDSPHLRWIKTAIEGLGAFRYKVTNGLYSKEDFDKAEGYMIDGFSSLFEYYRSPYVELIDFEGDMYDVQNKKLLKNHVITIADRVRVVRNEPMESWLPRGTKSHVGWRLRPDNLYAMGPLHNLVGMQYRIDHLENIKADVFDLIAFPPLKIVGEVEEFIWAPGAEIHIDEGGDVDMLVPDTTALNADTQISILEQRMEDYAGAPKQAMGIRTPGEKTAYEVQALESAAGRIFKEKVQNFETELLEPILNAMLEVSRRNLDTTDSIRVFDDALGVEVFEQISKEDITANGKLRPVGASHFFAQQQMMQNLTGLSGSVIGQMIAPHVSTKQLALLVEELFGLEKYNIIEENAALHEAAERETLARSLQDQLIQEDAAAETLVEQPEENLDIPAE